MNTFLECLKSFFAGVGTMATIIYFYNIIKQKWEEKN